MLRHNTYNLSFNLKGEGSSIFHKELKNDIAKLNEIYANLSELIKKIGGYPIMNLDEIKSISSIKEISSKDYTLKEALNIFLNDISIINNMNNQVGEYALKNYDIKSINLILDFNSYFNERIWLLKIDK